MNSVFRILFLLFICFHCDQVLAHEKTPSYLQIDAEEGAVKVSFKYPLDLHGNQNIFLKLPGHWQISSQKNTRIGDMGIWDAVVKISSFEGKISIKRTDIGKAPLIITVIEKGKSSTVVLGADASSYELKRASASWFTVFKSFSLLGIEHILLGIDHLLFVLALLFLVQGKALVKAITAFTIAHSITLVISTLHIVAIPSAVVEALIAFSIVLMAVEVFRPQEQHQSKNYITMAFFFGLLHGFGFAGVLAELGLPEGNLLMALFSFNVGVEIGQLLFVGFVLMLMPIITKMIPKNMFVKICSYAIGSIGAFWFLDRTIGAWIS